MFQLFFMLNDGRIEAHSLISVPRISRKIKVKAEYQNQSQKQHTKHKVKTEYQSLSQNHNAKVKKTEYRSHVKMLNIKYQSQNQSQKQYI